MARAKEMKPESWKAFFVVGLIFPLHVILGVLSIPLLFYYLLMRSPTAWILALIYLPFWLYPAELRYPGWKGADWMWRFFDYTATCSSYFGEFAVHGSNNVDPSVQYFFACHPHGTVTFQRTFWRSSMLEELFLRPYRMLAASVIFKIPIMREISLLFGAIDASKANCISLLKNGVSLIVFPGGLDEANAASGKKLFIRTRTGFIRLAIEHGVPVLPIFTFGEADAVDRVNFLPQWLVLFFQRKFRMSTSLFVGRFYSFLPYRVPFHMCIGRPIETVCIDDDETAFDAEVKRVHTAYRAELKRLYEENKSQYARRDRELVFTH